MSSEGSQQGQHAAHAPWLDAGLDDDFFRSFIDSAVPTMPPSPTAAREDQLGDEALLFDGLPLQVGTHDRAERDYVQPKMLSGGRATSLKTESLTRTQSRSHDAADYSLASSVLYCSALLTSHGREHSNSRR